MAAINPYLIFNGNCEEAFNFYKSAFGGEFPYVGRFKDAPSDQQMSPSDGERIMHMSLPIGKTILMGSDSSTTMGDVSAGTNFSISINADSKEEADKLFGALSEGGKITMPLQDTFWGSYFGMFKDKFGIDWMINHDTNEEAI